MDKKFGVLLGALAAFILFVTFSISVIKGGVFNYMRALVMLAPFILMVFIHYRSVWHIMVPIALAAVRLRLPFYGLEKLTPIIVLSSLFIAITLAEIAINRSKRRGSATNWEDKLVFAMACFLSIRFLYDRPGFVSFGAEQGGLFLSLEYVVGTWVYFTVRRIVAMGVFTRKQLRVSARIVACLFAYAIIIKVASLGFVTTRMLGEQETWMLAAMILSLVITSPNRIKPKITLYMALSFIFLFMAAISNYRARFFYILSEVLAISYIANIFRRAVLIVAIVGSIGIAGAIAFQEHLPLGIDRFLSLFETSMMKRSAGSYGVQDSFRAELYKIAWQQMRRNPLFGNGFGLNVDAALEMLAVEKGQMTQIEIRALSGAYHNSIAALGVMAGIPMALIFAVVSFSIPLKFVRMLRSIQSSDFKTWGMVIIGFYGAAMSMMLVNGGQREFMYIMVLAGYMRGMMQNSAADLSLCEERVPDGLTRTASN